MALRTSGENVRATLDIVDTPLAKLRPWPRNPRRIRPERLEQLKAMLVAAPEMLRARPLIALMDGTVIAGNQRLVAATDLGWDSIPTVFVDLDERTAIEWALRDNNPMGEPDEDLTAELLAELDAAGADRMLTGYSPDETARLLARLNRRDADPDAVPPVLEATVSVLGTVYELGPHRVMCGDAGDPGHVEALVGTEAVHAVVTDPPYGIDRDGVPNDEPAGLRALFDRVLSAAPLEHAVIAAFQSPRLVTEWIDAVRDAGHTFERLLWLHRQAAKTYPWRGWVLASDAIAVSSVGKPRWPRPADFCHDTYVKTELEDASLTGTHSTIKPAWIVRDLMAKLPGGGAVRALRRFGDGHRGR